MLLDGEERNLKLENRDFISIDEKRFFVNKIENYPDDEIL